MCTYALIVRSGSSIGVAVHHGLDGMGIECRWRGENFRTRPEVPWVTPSLL